MYIKRLKYRAEYITKYRSWNAKKVLVINKKQEELQPKLL